MIRTLLLAALLPLVAVLPSQAASKPPFPRCVPCLLIQPSAARPHARITIVGTHFAHHVAIHLELDCPRYGDSRYLHVNWTARTDQTGDFILHERVPRPHRVTHASCHVYALDITARSAFLLGTAFHIR